jgi:hypothetical protein
MDGIARHNAGRRGLLTMKSRNFRRVVIVFLGLCGWWLISRNSSLPSPAAVFAASPITIEKSLTVLPGQEYQLTLSFPQAKTPGWLRGRWSVKGASANVKGAADDSLVGFTLISPDNRTLQRLDHPLSGNFNVRYEGGSYTFIFDNSGIIRSSSRLVTLEGTYQPD